MILNTIVWAWLTLRKWLAAPPVESTRDKVILFLLVYAIAQPVVFFLVWLTR